MYVISSPSEIHMKIYMWNSREYNIYCDFQIKSTGSSCELFYESIIILPFCLVLQYNIYMLKKWRRGVLNQTLLKAQTIGMHIVYVTINSSVNKKPNSIQEETFEQLSSFSDIRYLSESRSILDLFATIKTY